MQSKQWILNGCLSAFFAVVLGAFGAHALKERLNDKAVAIYQTAVHYHMFHALALVLLGLWAAQNPNIDTQWPGLAFTIGIAIFSGSLYALAVTDIKILGAITPIGGVLFLIGWIRFAFLVWKT